MTDRLRVPAGPGAGRPKPAKGAAAVDDAPPWRDDVNEAPTGVFAVPNAGGPGRGEGAVDPNEAPTGVRPFPSQPPGAEAQADVNELPTSVRPAPVAPPAPRPATADATPSPVLAESAETTKPVGAGKAGAWSRRHSQPALPAAQPVASESPAPEAPRPLDPAVRRRLLTVGSIGAGLVLALIGWAIFFRPPDQPTTQELQVLYPYGFEGAVGPRGERAPGALQVAIEFQKRVACTRHSDDLDCLLYRYSAGEFSGTMVVQKVGRFWIRPSDDGMPFRPQR